MEILDNEFSNAYNKIFVSFSGGKDSVSSYLKVIQHYPKHMVNLIFCDTGDELPETYEYIKWFNEKIHPVKRIIQKDITDFSNGRIYRKMELHSIAIDAPIEFVRKNYHTVYDEIRYKYQKDPSIPPFPTRGKRQCTTTLKVHTFYKWVRNQVPKKERNLCLVVIGLRRSESDGRKNTPDMAVELDHGLEVWYPIADFTLDDVLKIHKDNNIRVSPVYQISERSNCVGCAFNSMSNIKRAVQKYGEEIISEWIKIEEETGYTFKFNKSIKQYNEADDEPLVIEEKCNSGFCEF